MTELTHDPLVEFARSLPAALDDSALSELAVRLQPFLAANRDADASAERLYNPAEVARQVGVNVETVRRAIRSGALSVAARIGRSPRLTQAAIDDWLAGTVEIAENGQRRRVRRRQPRVRHEHSLRAAFNGNK